MKTVMRLVFSLMAAALIAPVQAGPVQAQQEQRVPVDQATTKQKAIFIQNLVSRSVAARTIESSGDAAAMAKLESARALVKEANGDLEAGRYAVANEKLDTALSLVNNETRRLSQTEMKQDRRQEAYEKRLHTVQTFVKAYERVAGEKKMTAASSAQLVEIRKLMAAAESRASSGNLEEATELLDKAYAAARGDIRQMREGETLTRSLNFETAEEEYSYERDRNESHLMLLRFAITEKNPPKSRMVRIDELQKAAVALREQAAQEAGAGKHGEAIDTLIESTDTLLKAIRMSGIYIPG